MSLKKIDFFNFKLGDSQEAIPISATDDFLKKLDIIHVYGQLGCFNWQTEKYSQMHNIEISKVLVRAPDNYGGLTNLSAKYAQYIETIGFDKWKDDNKPTHIQKAITFLKEAKKIFILGFGFYEENMKLLDFKEILAPVYRKKVFYTNVNNQKKIEYRLDSFLEHYIKKGASQRNLDFIMSDRKIYEALDKDFDLC